MSELVINTFVDTVNMQEAHVKAMFEGCVIFTHALGVSFDLNIDKLSPLKDVERSDAPKILSDTFPARISDIENGLTRTQISDVLREGLFIVTTGQDLRAPGVNFCFGYADLARAAIVSSCNNLSPPAFRNIVAHELGHLAAMVGTNWSNHDNRGGLYEGHCKNPCIMRQVMSSQEAEKTAAKIDCFCDDCLGHLRRVGQLI